MALKSINVDGKIFDIVYDIKNSEAKRDIVFLHGWGSNKEIMKQGFDKFLKDYRHIYIDMPGFGKSENIYELTTSDYSNIIKEFLKELNSDFYAIAGHSFGGKVATLINPQNLILLSSAGILEKKPFKVRFKIFFAKVLNSLGLSFISKAFRSKDVSKMSENMYKTFKNVVDEDFTQEFEKIKNRTLIFWGMEDKATSMKSGEKISEIIDSSILYKLSGDHYFFLKHSKQIAGIIEDELF
ncbi:alpha/beta fold hydrolase [Arcobacter porcinus]|uniref:2-succinyl-6-hydroxy-2, 4-cyclohexadiene-1-carboxylate synthase n=1 Tax=Arcobacter porcinus TaxID=1935204 RepID=A0A1C0B120_9BACT|nr:alpha/beta hydrolase [Arcobacter porcinus]OCL87126.1 2-succinyl-6-hydroxy-2,4-cyclohexadiene-1-carboxylate synthase [Aliarcobacter thereius]OCL82359.1 2-succinyl-6-hydroxy-2,4-cyclohexadiene-1-carboxylate synthase [Arcobacter porcinus]OCL82649.1 2-succinyl-6-hydroxy-2,4-cyclohexadiene-1-carboxylate synthase [Arcobacter porcinus]OCL87219.1 2-succinyl-6-hydroxy-2,4-cyclohexadiene-1-carboxylate synthase [Arcobacter porcinus]OCL93410.1 2-succinyl-6-hydroxy-2,4-cyclohexadiene-1-carboxylate synth